MENIDLRLLKLLDELDKNRSVSRTSESLGLTQPAVSIALAKLRRHFGDPLFVPTPNGMQPTPQTLGFMPMVREAIPLLEAMINFHLHFEPASADRLFRLCMTDVGQIVLLPTLLNRLRKEAPRVRIEVSNIGPDTPNKLEIGDIDLAVGFVPQLDDHFYQEPLFEEQFVCLVRRKHPRIKGKLTKAQFEAESHVVVASSGTGHLIVDRIVAELQLRREVGVRIPNFLGLATVVGNTDYLCTLPARAGQILARNRDVVTWPVPFRIPSYVVRQHWHERHARDPGHRWLREQVLACA